MHQCTSLREVNCFKILVLPASCPLLQIAYNLIVFPEPLAVASQIADDVIRVAATLNCDMILCARPQKAMRKTPNLGIAGMLLKSAHVLVVVVPAAASASGCVEN